MKGFFLVGWCLWEWTDKRRNEKAEKEKIFKFWFHYQLDGMKSDLNNSLLLRVTFISTAP